MPLMEKTYKNIHNSAELMKIEKKLIWEQRSLSRKYENLKKGESTQKKYTKSRLKIQKLHHKIDNIRTDYINKIIAEIVKNQAILYNDWRFKRIRNDEEQTSFKGSCFAKFLNVTVVISETEILMLLLIWEMLKLTKLHKQTQT